MYAPQQRVSHNPRPLTPEGFEGCLSDGTSIDHT